MSRLRADSRTHLHVFQFDSQRHYRYSDNALRRMQQALADGLDMDAVGAARGASRSTTR